MRRYGCGGSETEEPYPSRPRPSELGHVGETDRGYRERSGGSLATPAGRLYAKAAISVAADWRLTVAGAASGVS
jgi:hypothetical protein